MEEHGLEQLSTASSFVALRMVRKLSEIAGRTWPLTDFATIPKNSQLHHFENLFDDQRTEYIPDLSNYSGADRSIKKAIYHINPRQVTTSFNTSLMRYRPAGVELVLRKFREERKGEYLFPKGAISNQNTLVLVNHNPLSAYKQIKTQPNDTIEYLLTLHRMMLSQLKSDKINLLRIPVPDDTEIQAEDIIRVLKNKALNKLSVRKQIFSRYFIGFASICMMFNADSAKGSPYSSVGTKVLNSINLYFQGSGRGFVINLSQLRDMITSPSELRRFIKAVNELSAKSQVLRKSVVETPISPTGNPEADIPVETVPAEGDGEGFVVDELEPLPEMAMSTDAASIDQFTELNIDNQPNLTPAQKDRLKKMSKQYKNLTVSINGKNTSVATILNSKAEVAVKDKEPIPLKGKVIDETYLRRKSLTVDQQYLDEHFDRHILASLIAFQANGLYLTDIQYEDENTEFNRVRYMTVKFKDAEGKSHTLKPKIPIPDREGRFMINGIQTRMVKQMVNVPICKVSHTRVNLISNYNKTLVEKHGAKRVDLINYLHKHGDKLGIILRSGKQSFLGVQAPYEFKTFGSRLNAIDGADFNLHFNLAGRYKSLKVDESKVEKHEKKYGIFFGTAKKNSQYLFIDMQGVVSVFDHKNNQVVEKTDLFSFITKGEIPPPAEWCNLKILDKDIPIVAVLAYRYGITRTLQESKAKYRIVKGRKYELAPTEVVIPFKDCKLIVDRYPLVGSLILNGLSNYPTRKYELHELDDEDTFYSLFMDKNLSINYLTGIKNYFSFFIDPITFEVLQEMKEPTNTKDLLIRAVELLVYDDDREPSSVKNFRSRNYEKVPAMIYNEISRQYANHRNSAYKNRAFSINPEGIYQRLVQDENMVPDEVINPIHSIKMNTKINPSGFGGRSKTSFVERDRRFPDDGVGKISEGTVDSGSAGMAAELPPDSNIKDIYGLFGGDDLDSVNILSTSSNLMPGVTYDDPKRAGFANIQLSHVVPVNAYKPNRISTGYELTVAQNASSEFAVKAEGTGKITAIDDKNKLIRVKYNDGNSATYEFGELTTKASGSSYNQELVLKPGVKVGKTVKEGEILAYHKAFFELDRLTGEPAWCHGVNCRVAITMTDATLEDSNVITEDFANTLTFNPVYEVVSVVDAEMEIKNHVKIGEHVEYDTPLLVTGYSLDPSLGEVDDLFEELQQNRHRAKHHGEIKSVRLYACAENMSESIKKYALLVNKASREKAKFAKGTIDEGKFTPIVQVAAGTRVAGTAVNEDTVVIVHEIKATQPAGVGDKIIFDSSLKTVVGEVVKSIVGEDGIPIDAKFSALSVFNRIVISPLRQGIGNSILIAAEKEIIAMAKGETPGKKK